MKWIKSLNDLKEHIFSNKERVAENTKDITAEKPREIYTKVCNEIAEKLSNYGFKYSPSQNKLSFESDDKKYSLFIKFSSNPENVANQYIELKGTFYVDSKELKKFTKANPFIDYWNETIIGRDLGILIDNEKGNVIWNLADENDYNSALKIIPEICKTKLFDYFEQLQNVELVTTEILNDNFELSSPVCTTQYLLCHNKIKEAENYLEKFLQKKRKIINNGYSESKAEINKNGLPEQYIMGEGYGYDIALLEKFYKLNLNEK
jgi:hypothetical protein